ncbi:helix-turn-helix transcriptional regulator [Rhodococcus sp. IEGM 1330]|uniref:helix-turn-helix transcriptional regulator n=1 Tax=Rhodococcus sp. IEGM 1330 TaxID=3082225 RepID=UPI002954FD8A|nr:LuxR C-terminal-related transcriptional regulator [Rhodococcus sp. IEGM 1330]
MTLLQSGTGRATVIEQAERILTYDRDSPNADCAWLSLLALLYADRFSDAAAHSAILLEASSRDVQDVATLIQARIDAQTGGLDSAITSLEMLYPTKVPPCRRGVALAWLVEALADNQDFDAAHEHLLNLPAQSPPLPDQAHILAARGHLYAAQGDHGRSLHDLIRSGKILTSLGVSNPAVIPWRSTAATMAVKIGHTSLALSLAQEGLSTARLWGSAGVVGRALRAFAHTQDADIAANTLVQAIELLELAGTAKELILALCDLGEVSASDGNIVQSHRALDRAVQEAMKINNRFLLERARSVLATVDQHRDVASLTSQEYRIAILALNGQSNKSIAKSMFLTIRTVEFHLTNVYRKLQISNRRQLGHVMSTRRCA